MDFVRYLPVELIEEIFSYLSAKDLANCSEVSVIWREVANNGNLWRTICGELSLDDPWTFGDIESSFEDTSSRFQLPPLPDRLSPMSEWKMCYCQYKYIHYNWRQGRYANFLVKYQNFDFFTALSPRYTSKRCAQVYPIVEETINYEMNMMRIDGKPKKVYQHELSPHDNLRAMFIEGNTITFIIEKKLKTLIYQNNEFNMVCEYDLGPENKLNENAFKICCRVGNILNYFISMTSSYLVTTCEAYFHVWDRKTGNELGFVNCPTDQSEMYYFCLQSDSVYFVTPIGVRHNKLYEYNIVKKTLGLVDTIYADLACDILSNELYLIIFTWSNYGHQTVSFYDRSSKKVNEITCSSKMNVRSIHNNLLFFLSGSEVSIMHVPSWRKEGSFALPYSEIGFIGMHNVGHNLLIISRLKKNFEVWDWKKGVFCSSIDCSGRLVWCDPIRLVVERLNNMYSTYESELSIIGFW